MALPENIDKEKLAEVALAILSLGACGDEYEARVWKGLDWEITDLLFINGWIGNPKGKSKSLVLTEVGEKQALVYLSRHFSE